MTRRTATSTIANAQIVGPTGEVLQAFHAGNGRVLLAGLNGEEMWLVALGSTDSEQIVADSEQIVAVDIAGVPLHPRNVNGRGSRLYFQDRDSLWVIDLGAV